jgi:hypothetical protein
MCFDADSHLRVSFAFLVPASGFLSIHESATQFHTESLASLQKERDKIQTFLSGQNFLIGVYSE